jgi:hypothetical protein
VRTIDLLGPAIDRHILTDTPCTAADVLIQRWSQLHLVRVVLAALSFGVVVAEAVVV